MVGAVALKLSWLLEVLEADALRHLLAILVFVRMLNSLQPKSKLVGSMLMTVYIPSPWKRAFALIFCLISLNLISTAAQLKPETTIAFDKYVSATEARINGELRPGGIFLYVDSFPTDTMKSCYERLRKGEVLVEKRETKIPGVSSHVPDGMVHHWVAIIFIPGVTLTQVLSIVQDYDRRSELYKPEVIASHLISHEGDDYLFFLRLYQKRFTTIVFNTEYETHWGKVDSEKVYSHSISTKIAGGKGFKPSGW